MLHVLCSLWYIVLSRIHTLCHTCCGSEPLFFLVLQIKRPYFHAKPLDKYQLQNWHDYLDFEVVGGDHKRTVFLFERCVIACAMYEEYWLKVSVTLGRAVAVLGRDSAPQLGCASTPVLVGSTMGCCTAAHCKRVMHVLPACLLS